MLDVISVVHFMKHNYCGHILKHPMQFFINYDTQKLATFCLESGIKSFILRNFITEVSL
jgi:hypothetical protein